MTAARGRNGLEVITRLYELTQEMERRKDDADFLIASVDQRQNLMDEYDLLHMQETDFPEEEARADMARMVKEIIGIDAVITAALEEHKKAAKEELIANNRQQKMLGYANQASSYSGSYMDYKK